MKPPATLSLLMTLCGCVLINSAVRQDNPVRQSKASDASTRIGQSWENAIRPLLAQKCLECHSSIEHSGKLDLESLAGLFRGGLSGSAIDHQNPADSLLLKVLQKDAKKHMPPDEQLSDDEIGLITKWIEDLKQLESLPTQWHSGNANMPQDVTQSNNQPGIHPKDSDPISSLPFGLNPSLVIDLVLESAWHANNVTPATVANDASFARRLYLDLVGRIPLESELELFVSNADSRKREQLVDSLLATDEHAQHMAEVLSAVLMGRNSSERNGSERKRQDEKLGWMEFLTTAIRTNRPWNEVAREIILARPTRPEDRGAAWYLHSRKNKHQEIAEAISKDFFGVRIDCAQCHDHPLASEIEQRHYWGLVAFFNRSTNADSPDGPRIAESAIGGFSEFTNLGGKSSENKLVFLRAQPVEEARPAKDVKEEDRDELYFPADKGEPKIPKFSRRQQFVDQVLRGNPLVAEAMVNRLWGWMFGRGIVHPVDALDSIHPASHPGLLEWLSRDFERSNYDVRRLLRYLALSRAYQLESTTTAGSDPKWFASGLTKPLIAESLYRSFLVALDVTDSAAWNETAKRGEFASLFPDVLTEESLANVTQGLWLSNSQPIREMVSAKNSKLIQQVLQIAEPGRAVDRLYQRMLGRQPDAQERNHCVEFLDTRADQRQAAIENLTWALITSAEFRFNH